MKHMCPICYGPVKILSKGGFYLAYRCKNKMCGHEGEVSVPVKPSPSTRKTPVENLKSKYGQ